MTWWVCCLALCFFITRATVVFYYAVVGSDWMDWTDLISGKDDTTTGVVFPVWLPISGEIWFLWVMTMLFILHPLVMVGSAGERLRKTLEDKKQRKAEDEARRKEYLDRLSKYGLTPKDIPNYIKDPASLKKYLEAWKVAN